MSVYIELTEIVQKVLILHFIGHPQIERELVLSSGDKGSTKIPLMNDRTSGLQHLLPRSTSGAVAPDHPPKQLQAWVSAK